MVHVRGWRATRHDIMDPGNHVTGQNRQQLESARNNSFRTSSTSNSARIRYVIAGGLAAVAHGYLRLTMDVDLVIDLERDNLLRALTALEMIGYQPRLPVTKEQFVDDQTRERWVKEKHKRVFPLWNPSDVKGILIGISAKCPFDFAEEYAKAK